MFDWDDVRIFLSVARHGSTMAAARALNINQTTVGRRIDAIEHGLGLTLFERDTRGCRITPLGQALLLRAEALEGAACDLQTEADRLMRDLSGVIRVTAPESIMTHIVSPVIVEYRRFHPEVRFENLSAEHRLNLERGEADVAFRASDQVAGDTLVCRRLPDVCWTVYASEGYAAAHGLPASLRELGGHSVVAFSGTPAMQSFSIRFMSHVQGPQVVATSNSIPNMSGILRSGMGIGLLACFDGDDTPGLVRCFPPPRDLDSAWWIVASQDAYAQPRVRSFMAFAAERIGRSRPGLRGGPTTP